ncbi:hypothetical protein GCM10010174_81660 [Kutzneria viridogrisea]|uniref:PPE family protein n=1 Tax=Kutzneria viridogrisea TaxID=47990 RepID=A0ABR6BEC9_9PSEU|nr:hypothetical protein [Kutzneria viridogrisea]
MLMIDPEAWAVGLTAQQIYQAVRGQLSAGTGSLDEAAAAAEDLRRRHDELERSTLKVISAMDAAWQGAAAQDARAGAAPLVTAMARSQQDLSKAQHLIQQQSDSFRNMRHALVVVPPKPTVINMPLRNVDLDKRIEEWNRAQRTNIALYNAYNTSATYASANMPSAYGGTPVYAAPAPRLRVAPPSATPGTGHPDLTPQEQAVAAATSAQGAHGAGVTGLGSTGYGPTGFGGSGSPAAHGGSAQVGGVGGAGFGAGVGRSGADEESTRGRAGAGRAGAAAGAAGGAGMAGAGAPGGAGGKQKGAEDAEHASAAYLHDDYSSDLIGELPPTTRPVIGG